MTIAKCAAHFGKTQPAWTLYETGKRFPKLDEFLEICNLLNTTPNELLGVSPSNEHAVVNAGDGSAVSFGGNASVVNGAPSAPGESAECRKCPYRKKLEKLEKLLSK